MNFVGLDLSLVRTGFCVLNRECAPEVWGVVDPRKLRGPARLAMIRDSLLSHIGDSPCVVVIEGYSMGSKGRVFHIGELGGVIRVALLERGACAVLTAAPTVLKRFATGKGNADKPKMIAAAASSGFRTPDDNEADAYFLARMAYSWHRRGAETELRKTLTEEMCLDFPTTITRAPKVAMRRRSRV